MDLTTINNTTLLILAGGMGSRYKGQKQIDTISENNETLMEYALYDAVKVGIRKFVFIINEMFPEAYKKTIYNLLTRQNAEVHFIEQTLDKHIPKKYLLKLSSRRKPLGTAHAVYCAKDKINGPFITMNADDFYGLETFKTARLSIDNKEVLENQYVMLAFELGNTLSENGSVSRGKCDVTNGLLYKVEEYTFIEKMENQIMGLDEEMKAKTLQKNDLVSMNFWILDPSFFQFCEKELFRFLEENSNVNTNEFYLPSVIDTVIQNKKVNVKVLATSEKWFGLTYPGDKQKVMSEIQLKKQQGVYPEKLWNNFI